MSQRVLGADGDNGFRGRVQIDVVVRLVSLHDLVPQTRNSFRYRIAVVLGIPQRLNRLIHNYLGGSAVRISHSQIHNVVLVCA